MQHITVTESLLVRATPAAVFDYTQDYARRREWDDNVIAATVEPGDGPPRVRLRLRGGIACVFQYKVFERPRRTGLAMTEVRSLLIGGGGGAWTYEDRERGTWWTQTNTLVFRHRALHWCLGSITRWQLARGTRRAMGRARRILEAGHA